MPTPRTQWGRGGATVLLRTARAVRFAGEIVTVPAAVKSDGLVILSETATVILLAPSHEADGRGLFFSQVFVFMRAAMSPDCAR